MLKKNNIYFVAALLLTPWLASAQKRALVCGAGGFIGSHLVDSLKERGYWVRGVDVKRPEFSDTKADEFVVADLRSTQNCLDVTQLTDGSFDEVYQLAADMGGMGFISTHNYQIMHNSVLINANLAGACIKNSVKKVFYSSSACVYPERNQLDPMNPLCSEESAYPAAPDTEYGWEKLFSERLWRACAEDHGIEVRIARFHNIFGPQGTWCGGREKAPAAISRKVAEASGGGAIEIWGLGDQTRSFLFIDECIEGVRQLMESSVIDVVNIGSEEMIAINDLARMVIRISGKNLTIKNIDGPAGVRGRNSDNRLIRSRLGWAPSKRLEDGMRKTYAWVNEQHSRTIQS